MFMNMLSQCSRGLALNDRTTSDIQDLLVFIYTGEIEMHLFMLLFRLLGCATNIPSKLRDFRLTLQGSTSREDKRT